MAEKLEHWEIYGDEGASRADNVLAAVRNRRNKTEIWPESATAIFYARFLPFDKGPELRYELEALSIDAAIDEVDARWPLALWWLDLLAAKKAAEAPKIAAVAPPPPGPSLLDGKAVS